MENDKIIVEFSLRADTADEKLDLLQQLINHLLELPENIKDKIDFNLNSSVSLVGI